MFPIIEVAGSGYERGHTYGSAVRTRVQASLRNYTALFAACGIHWQEIRCRSRPYEQLIRDFDGALHQELRGIAAGAEVDLDDILALNARTELLPAVFFDSPAAASVTATDFSECSALAVPPPLSATGKPLLAQNWDWLGGQREALVLLRGRHADGRASLTLTEAGMLAKIGCNDRGFGFCLNVLRSRDDGAVAGVPVHVLLRSLLECDSVEQAVARIAPLRFAASSNIMCADVGGEAASIELTPNGAYVLRDSGAVLCHTNHFLAQPAAQACGMAPGPSSIPRLKRLRELTRRVPSRFSVADVQRMLSDESAGALSISRHPDSSLPPLARFETVASVVMELASAILHVAPDIPTRTCFRQVPLRSAPLSP